MLFRVDTKTVARWAPQVPGSGPDDDMGGVDAAEVTTVIDYLTGLTARHRLPRKLLVLHQCQPSTLRQQNLIGTGRRGVAVLIDIDAQGDPALKDQA